MCSFWPAWNTIVCGICPISPALPLPADGGLIDGGLESEEEETVDQKDAALGDPIVGRDRSLIIGTEGGMALSPMPLMSPQEPTQAQRALHDLTHLPYASWCPHCVACRRPNTHHRGLHQERRIPLLCGPTDLFAILRTRVW